AAAARRPLLLQHVRRGLLLMAVFVNDTFTDTNGTTLGSHTGETGATWTKYPGYTSDDAITSNRLRGPGSATYGFYLASGTPGVADYDVEGELFVVSDANGTGDSWAILGRADSAADSYYYVTFHATNGEWQLVKNVTSSFTTLGTYTQALSVSSSYVCKLQ